MAGLTYDGIPSTRSDSSTFSGTDFQGVTGSFTNVRTGGSIVAGRLNDGNGAIFSTSVGSTATYGAVVQAGSSMALLATTGSLTFGRVFADTNYYLVLTPTRSGTSPWGVLTNSTSGAEIYGASGGVYNYIAVGFI